MRNLTLSLILLFPLFLLSCKKDPCKDVICENGNPVATDDVCNCDCDAYYEGTLCDKEIRENFYGTFDGDATCEGFGTSSSEITITKGSTVGRIIIDQENNVYATVIDAVNYTIPSQTVTDKDGNTYTVEGSGVRSGDVLTSEMTFTFDPTTTMECTFTGSR